MTNDGDLANSLSKAAAGVEKTYLVKVSGVPPACGLEQIRRGIMIDRGRLDEVRSGRRDRIITAPAKVELVRGGDNPWYELTLTEGRNRQIRKMFEEIGHHVEKIRRIGYGALRLDVPPGEFRELTPGEVMALDRAAKGKKVVPKKKTPEFAQLKAPAKKKSTGPPQLRLQDQSPRHRFSQLNWRRCIYSGNQLYSRATKTPCHFSRFRQNIAIPFTLPQKFRKPH